MASNLEFVSFKEFVENLPARTVAKSGDKTVVSNPTDGPGSETNAAQAQKVLAGNVAQAFDPTRDEEHQYLAGEKVVYGGEVYLFLVNHYGPWVDSDVKRDESVVSLQQKLSSRISSLEKEIDGETVVFSESTTWGTRLNGKWKIGTLYAGKTLSILVSCENPPANEVMVYFSTGYNSETIIDSETKTAVVGIHLEVVIPAEARYIWIFKNVSADAEKLTTLEFIDVSSSASLKQEFLDLKYDVSGGLILSGSLTWGSNLNSGAKSLGEKFASKKISILVSCENPPATSVTIYFSTGNNSSTVIYAETKTAVIGTPLEVIVPETARYIWFFNLTAGNSNAVTYSVSYVGDLTHRVENLENKELDLTTLSCEVSSNSVQVRQNLVDGKSRRVVFSRFGPSNIMQLRSIAVYGSSGQILSSKSTSTDSLGPFVVHAVNNADGDNENTPKFTGGCHGYNGDQTGAATASCEVKVVADGKEISSGSYDCFNLSVIVTNKVQGWNTRKSDGTGREIIKEKITYKISGSMDKILVFSDIEALEDVVFELYYGLQIAFARDAIRFTCGEFSEWLTTEYPSYSGDTLDSVDGKSTDGFYQEMSLYKKGLGHFAYNGNYPKAFRSNTKGYYSLIRGEVSVAAGKIIRLAGCYSFNFIGTEVVPIKFGSFKIDNASIDKYFSTEDLPEGTYKLKYFLSGENNGTGYVNVYTASAHQSSGIISTYANAVQGQELTISVTSATKIIWFFNSSSAKTELSYVLYQ